ncbi:MAG TPA: hypothetical protein VNN72_20825 [Polyangiaceae bacterium]|nr:hypothetical protein [Polyangiaceae bacterium]
MRADARRKRRLALLAFLCWACTLESNENKPVVSVTAPRLLDELCNTGAYTLTGTAVRTAGLTQDSCGFELGPGAGEVAFELAVSGGGIHNTTKISGLLLDLDADGPTNARWVPLLVLDATSPDTGAPTQTITVGTTDRRIGLVDLEVWSETTFEPTPACSMARHRPR